MAENENDELDLDAKPASGGKKKIIIIAVIALLVIGAAVGGALMFMGGDEEAPVEGEEPVEVTEVPETHYLPLEKIVVAFADPSGAKYIQVKMEMMSHNPEVLDVIKEHMPVIRNDLLLLLTGQKSQELRDIQGKEKLRGDILTTVQKIVKENSGLDGPQAVYFTNFVMQ